MVYSLSCSSGQPGLSPINMTRKLFRGSVPWIPNQCCAQQWRPTVNPLTGHGTTSGWEATYNWSSITEGTDFAPVPTGLVTVATDIPCLSTIPPKPSPRDLQMVLLTEHCFWLRNSQWVKYGKGLTLTEFTELALFSTSWKWVLIQRDISETWLQWGWDGAPGSAGALSSRM